MGKDLIKRLLLKQLNESRYSLKGRSIIRIRDGLKGEITDEVAYGKAYRIQWENGKTQQLGTSTIKNKMRYELK